MVVVEKKWRGVVPVPLWEQGSQVSRVGSESVVTKWGEVTLAVCLVLVSSHVGGCGQSWPPQCENEVDLVKIKTISGPAIF